MRGRLNTAIPLRALQSAFLAPVSPGRKRIAVALLRQGKSVTQLQGRMLDGDEIDSEATAAAGGDANQTATLKPHPSNRNPQTAPLKPQPCGAAMALHLR